VGKFSLSDGRKQGVRHPGCDSQDLTDMAQTRSFNPYTENGGTILAIAGQDFSVIAGDTRQSEGYNIQTRYAPKVFRLYVCDSPSPSRFPTFCFSTEQIAQSWP
jgi:hypothetical protein